MGNQLGKQIDILVKQHKQSSHTLDNDEDGKRFKEGKPVFQGKGIEIRKNQQTNKLQGIPQEWATHIQLPFDIDFQNLINTRNFSEQIRPEEFQDLPQPIIDILNSCQSEQSQQNTKLSARDSLRGQVKAKNFQKSMQFRDVKVNEQKPYGLSSIPESLVTTIRTSFSNPLQVNNPSVLADIISQWNIDLMESRVQRELLSTEQFESIVKHVTFIPENPNKKYFFSQQLGRGRVCKVYKARSRDRSGKTYAVRIMKQNNRQKLNKIRCQIAVMQLCQSSNIIKYDFTYFYRKSLFMFIEYMDAGCLTKFISSYPNIPERVIAYVVGEVVQGLLTIHEKRQIHRDIKSDNILTDKEGNIKIADFGYGIQLTADKLNTNGFAGTAAWMAPELIKKEQYDEMVDIWSLGILIIELCQGQPPYLKVPPIKAMYKIATQDPPTIKGRSLHLQDFAYKCLRKVPEERSTVRQLLIHPFLVRRQQKKLAKQQFVKMINKYNKA